MAVNAQQMRVLRSQDQPHLEVKLEAEASRAVGPKRVHIILGDENDPNSTHVVWWQAEPGHVTSPHSHVVDYTEICVEGSLTVGKGRAKQLIQAGDARIVRAGTGYGEQVIGPEGATVIVVFSGADYKSRR